MNISLLKKQTLTLSLIVFVASILALPGSTMGHGSEKHDNHSHERKSFALCETDRHGFEMKIYNLMQSADKFAVRYDGVLVKLNAYVSEHGLTVENGETLRANAASSAASVKTELGEMKTMIANLNCDNPEQVAANQDAFRAQLRETKSALKTYKQALKAYKHAIKIAAEAAAAQP